MPFQVFAGPRGDGKTFSSLRAQVMEERDTDDWHIKDDFEFNKFIYLRRRQSEVQIATAQTANPFKGINLKYGIDVVPKYSSREKYSTFFVTNDDGIRVPVGYGAALSTFASLRGVNFEDVSTIIFDEAIPESTQIKMAGEGNALLNLYESVNRNRELFGKPPVKLYILSNAVDLGADIYVTLRIVSVIAHLMENNQSRATFKERGLYIELLGDSDFRSAKADTALYRLTAGSEFASFALDNEFVSNDTSHVRNVNLNEYLPMCTFMDTYTMYRHKSKDLFYVAEKNPQGGQRRFHTTNANLFRTIYRQTYNRAIAFDSMYYDQYATKIAFDSIINELKYRRI